MLQVLSICLDRFLVAMLLIGSSKSQIWLGKKMKKPLDGHRALVTGAAQGLGEGIARALRRALTSSCAISWNR